MKHEYAHQRITNVLCAYRYMSIYVYTFYFCVINVNMSVMLE